MSEARKLAAILVADIVGFSRLTASDEDRTLARIRALRSDLVDPTIAVHRGRVVKGTGDGVLVEFRSVVDAARCAIELQTGMIERNSGLSAERRIELRIGIHIGDVVEEADGDLMGDGVNIAARLEGLANPGTICLSEDAYRQVRARLDLSVSDLGEKSLKNIAEPMRVYALEIGVPSRRETAVSPKETKAPLALPDKPSIAVLPFQNMSGDVEQEYFADGMVEEIITALSRFNALFVIARNSTFTYKGRAIDVKQVGREFGVRYVLEGSVRKAGDRVRITGQLIDAASGVHLWADRFDGGLDDIFELQDQVTSKIVGAIAPRLEVAEIDRSRRKPTESLDAYDFFLRGLAELHQWTREANHSALEQFLRATELDPKFAAAFGMAAHCYDMRPVFGWVEESERESAECLRLATRAAELGKEDAVALSRAGACFAFIEGDYGRGLALISQSLSLNPNMAFGWLVSGWAKVHSGDLETAIEHIAKAMRLSPYDPYLFDMQAAMAYAHFLLGREHEAVAWAESAERIQPNFVPALHALAASLVMAGKLDKANAAFERARRLKPSTTLSHFDWLKNADHAAKIKAALRRVGMPD